MDAQTETSKTANAGAVNAIADKARETVTQVQDEVRERASDALETVRAKTGNVQATLADTLQTGAEAIRDRVGSVGAPGHSGGAQSRVASAGDAVAGALERSAFWLRENDLTDFRAVVGRQLKEHPGRTALVALGVGVLIGRASKRRYLDTSL